MKGSFCQSTTEKRVFFFVFQFNENEKPQRSNKLLKLTNCMSFKGKIEREKNVFFFYLVLKITNLMNNWKPPTSFHSIQPKNLIENTAPKTSKKHSYVNNKNKFFICTLPIFFFWSNASSFTHPPLFSTHLMLPL